MSLTRTEQVNAITALPQTLDAVQAWLASLPHEEREALRFSGSATNDCVLAQYFRTQAGVEEVYVGVSHWWINATGVGGELSPAFVTLRALHDARSRGAEDQTLTAWQIYTLLSDARTIEYVYTKRGHHD